VKTFLATLSVLGALAVALPASAQSAPRCTHDSLAVDGTALAVSVCATPGGKAGSLAVTETFKSATASFVHSTSLDVLPGTDISRSVDDVPLDRIGSARVLHLTLVARNGVASIEHALLLPGAQVLK